MKLGALSAAEARQEFNQLLWDAGTWVIYTRTDRRFPCRTCRTHPDDAPRSNCATCFGTGYRAVLEPWLAYWANSLRRPGELNSPLTLAGYDPQNTPVVCSRREDTPETGDRFFLVEWDREWERVSQGGRPVRLVQALHVHTVEPYALREVVYYVSHCNYVTEAAHQLWSALANAPLEPARL